MVQFGVSETYGGAAMIRIVLILVMLFLAGPVAAGPLEDGWAAYQRQDYATALLLWRPLAEQGKAIVQSLLGLMYAHGHGVPQDYVQAAKWYRLAAEQGHALSQGVLGEMYEHGRGVPQDYVQAAKWYRLAAEQGHA